MTDPIDLLDEASWLYWMDPILGDDALLVEGLRGERAVGDLRRLIALARDAEPKPRLLNPEEVAEGAKEVYE